MTKILGISGKKQSGKDTAANYILGSLMKKLEYINGFKITQQGKLYVYGWTDGFAQDCIVDYDDNTWPMSSLKKNYLDKYIKLYSFADCLKQQICIKMLGLTYEQCYGTDEQKNSLTHLKWEDMPGVLDPESASDLLCQAGGSSVYPEEIHYYFPGTTLHKPGFMTAREVLQFVGTEIMRKMYGNAHVNATMNQIKQDAPEYAIIRDTRFINEVEGVSENGLTCRLLRDVNKGKDQHESETALDNYPLDKFSLVVDNTDMSIQEQNAIVYEFLKTQGWNI
jgi:hypothetical protein